MMILPGSSRLASVLESGLPMSTAVHHSKRREQPGQLPGEHSHENPPPQEETPPAATETSSEASPWGLILGVVAVILIIGACCSMLGSTPDGSVTEGNQN